MKSNLRNLLLSALAFAGTTALALGTSPKAAMAANRGKVMFETCANPRPLWCSPGSESDLCNGGGGLWYFGCVNNGGQS
jgi:hypothetical protein